MRNSKSGIEDIKEGIITLEESRAEGGYPEEIEGTLFVDPRKIPIDDISSGFMNIAPEPLTPPA